MNVQQHYYILLCLLLFFTTGLMAQSSFTDILDQVETWQNPQIGSNPEQGFVIANDLKKAMEEGQKHGFYLARYDTCGFQEWSKLYINDEFALFLEAVNLLPNGEIAVTGLTGSGDVFLLKTDPAGEVLSLNTYHISNYDQPYALQYQNDQFMIFGSYVDSTTAIKRNFMMVTDPEGAINWSRAYFNTDNEGDAIYTADGGFFCRNGNVFYKLDETGTIQWAQRFVELNPLSSNISNLIELSDGYAFAVREPNSYSQYLVKLNQMGLPILYSDQFACDLEASHLSTDGRGNILLTNNYPLPDSDNSEFIPMVISFSEKAKITAQYQLELSEFGTFSTPVCAIGADTALIVHGGFESEGNFNYVALLTPDVQLGCSPILYEESTINAARLNNQNVSPVSVALTFERADSTEMTAQDINLGTWEFCERTIEEELLEMDSTITCVDTFHFHSPIKDATYLWKDGKTDATRVLKAPGIYEVEITACNKIYPMTIRLDLGYCPCDFYIPNAFSPNADDVNDTFKVFATCGFIDYDIKVFDRWGALVHESSDPNQAWDGTHRGRSLPTGVYIYALQYSWELQPGRIREEVFTGSLTIMR
ncbi:MAG: hypothetical protein DHS20C18_23230 [Saprospiraceae bacterium]|nr:MAG: hypothetical protein DHS20C18_23230 [Saprospiraceae bacterium]